MRKHLQTLWELVSGILALLLMVWIAHEHGLVGVWVAVVGLLAFHVWYRCKFGRWMK
jgi:uncharacterized membrane protein